MTLAQLAVLLTQHAALHAPPSKDGASPRPAAALGDVSELVALSRMRRG
jgi:hypothetical protein